MTTGTNSTATTFPSSPADAARTDLLWNLGNAALLGASWTWCIGMFLPVLLIRDWGLGGFFVFVVPNVVGAAAMGWALRDAAASRAMQAGHARACAWFSAVTIAFHLYWATWMATRLLGQPTPVVMLLLWLAVPLLTEAGLRRRPQARGAYVLLVSAVLFAVGWRWLPGLPVRGAAPTSLPGYDVLFLAPVCAFGFLLCPYLDLTFHLARQSTSPRGGRVAFGVGFGVLFAAMTLFTLAYSGWLARGGVDLSADRRVANVLLFHFLAQTLYTVVLHLEMLSPARGAAAASEARTLGPGARDLWLIGIGCVVVGGLAARPGWPDYHHFAPGEVVYRCFMSFYGLLFPAYVWLRIVPRRDGRTNDPARALLVFWAAVAIAAPTYWLGFIEQKTIWLVPGLLVVLLSRLMLRPAVAREG